jgi:hypothetical protein
VIAAGSILVALAVVMALCVIGAGVLQGMSWIAGPAHATDARSFSVSGTPTVTLHMDAGTMHVVSGGSGQVSVSLYKEVHAITHAAAQQALDGITLDATQSGDAITVTVHGLSFDANFASLRRTLDLTLTVPASANLSATVSAGTMEIGDVAGNLDVRMDAGNLTLRDVTLQGDSSLRLSAGNLDFRGAIDPGATVDVSVDAGNATLRLPRATPTHLAARTSAGNIAVIGWPGGDAHARSNDTLALDLNPQPTNTLTVQVSFGNVTVLATA